MLRVYLRENMVDRMSLENAMREWKAEVSAEMERLIRLGVPPFDAAIQARQRVEKRRRETP